MRAGTDTGGTFRFGVHALALVPSWGTARALEAVEKAADLGYDVLELPMFEPRTLDISAVRRAAAERGLGLTCSLGLGFDEDISSLDSAVAARGATLLSEVVDAAAELGAGLVGGVIFSAMGKYRAPASEQGRMRAAEVLRDIARKAALQGITVALEVVNRYESNLLNTAAQAVEFIGLIGEPNVRVHLDSYHMHIEEPDMLQPVAIAGELLGYVHVGECHRGRLGSGSVDLAALFRALHRVGYEGVVTFEAFSRSLVPDDLVGTLALWRDLYDDPLELAGHGLETMRALARAQRIRVLSGDA